MTREQLLDRLCEQAEESLFVSREQMRASLETWAIEPEIRDGKTVGAVLRRGPELHFATFGEPISRKTVVEALRPQLEQYGYVETRTPRHLERQHRFNRLIGFHAVGGDAFDIHYRMERAQCRLPL